jgi:hypothetical protein
LGRAFTIHGQYNTRGERRKLRWTEIKECTFENSAQQPLTPFHSHVNLLLPSVLVLNSLLGVGGMHGKPYVML